ncbi:hypothetical protein EYF80_001782 [Liparis tanakae]|uniref:Uncharacterized protein n=1 Tax=Liparis tanakae TaxID=230148 RepID=A0A4Z2JDU4_9TELE|nr:hypothetical protein EYF80_001782 [Liparis tanakae]
MRAFLSRLWPRPKPKPMRSPVSEYAEGSLVLRPREAAPERICSRKKTPTKAARMKAQLSTATATGSRVDGAAPDPGGSSPPPPSPAAVGTAPSGRAPSAWRSPTGGDLRCTWFWCGQEDRQLVGPVSEQVRQAEWHGRQAWTEDESTQLSRDRLRSCGPEVKPSGHNFTQPWRKREKPALHSGCRGEDLLGIEGLAAVVGRPREVG